MSPKGASPLKNCIDSYHNQRGITLKTTRFDEYWTKAPDYKYRKNVQLSAKYEIYWQ